jgi:cell division protein FtsL
MLHAATLVFFLQNHSPFSCREELKSLNAKVEEQGQDTENLQKKLEESVSKSTVYEVGIIL